MQLYGSGTCKESSHQINIHSSFHLYQLAAAAAAACPNPLNPTLPQIHISQCPWCVSKIKTLICLSHFAPFRGLQQLAVIYFAHRSAIWSGFSKTALVALHRDS